MFLHDSYPVDVNIIFLVLLSGCFFAPKVMRVENQLLHRENTELRDKLETCSESAAPADYLREVTMTGVVQYLNRAGYNEIEAVSDTVISIPVKGANTTFKVNIQVFERENVLFMVTAGYLDLEAATSSTAMVLLLTQLAVMNYELLIGKFQLNPSSGAISLSAELNLDDGMGFQTFQSILGHLIDTADSQYPALQSAAQGLGL